MKRSLKLLTSGIRGQDSLSLQESSSGHELKKVQDSPKGKRSALKERIISRMKEALTEAADLSAAKRMLITGLVTQALDMTTDAEVLEIMDRACGEFDAILTEFGR